MSAKIAALSLVSGSANVPTASIGTLWSKNAFALRQKLLARA